LKSPARFATFLFLAACLLQAAWIFAVPPFRNSDEFDHAYRAAAVADGQWAASKDVAQNGRGDIVRVPKQLVVDAGPECSFLKYVGIDNCYAIHRYDDGTVTVASAAARYNPVYYWLVGTAAKPFDGAQALYVMRVANLLLCAVVVALAGFMTARWASTLWPKIALAVAFTPVMVYSNSVPAPNGLEMSAALGVWTCLLGAVKVPRAERAQYLVAAGAFAVPMAGVRGLGPLLVALTGLSMLFLATPRQALAMVRENTRASLTFIGAALVAAAAGAWWTLTSGSMQLEDVGHFPHAVTRTFIKVPLWFFQSIAAFPTRTEPAPMVVYVAGAMLVGTFLVTGAWAADRTTRIALAVTVVLSVAVPAALEIHAYPTAGDVWQGRYGWPYTLGVVLICGFALDRRPPSSPFVPPTLVTGWLLYLVAQIVSAANVLVREQHKSPLAGDSRWLLPHLWLVVPLGAAGVAALAYAIHGWPQRQPPPIPEATPSRPLVTSDVAS
jgi:hypothetical protein